MYISCSDVRHAQFRGRQADIDEHLLVCKFEAVKSVLQKNELEIEQLKAKIDSQQKEAQNMRNLLVRMSARLESLESDVQTRFGLSCFSYMCFLFVCVCLFVC